MGPATGDTFCEPRGATLIIDGQGLIASSGHIYFDAPTGQEATNSCFHRDYDVVSVFVDSSDDANPMDVRLKCHN